MSDPAGLYQEVQKRSGSSNVPLYEAVADATGIEGDIQELSSLKEVVGGPKPKIGGGGIQGKRATADGNIKIDLNNPPGADASEEERNAYYDALAAQARAARQTELKADELDAVHTPLPNQGQAVDTGAKPSADQRALLMQQAMGGTAKPKRASGDGPSQDQRAALMQQAMQQATITKKAPSARPGGPSAEERMRLMQEAQSKSTLKPAAVAPKRSGPTEEQRRAMATQAQAAMAPKAAATATATAPRRGGPTAEQRAALAKQAMGSSKTAKSRPGAPTAEDRKRLMMEAMGRK